VGESSYLNHKEVSRIGFRSIGVNVKISKNAKIYGSKYISISDNARIDDFVIISTNSESVIGKNVHIGAGTFISASLGFYFGNYSGVSSQCSLYGDSDDYSGEFMSNPTFDKELRNVTSNKLIIEAFALIGTNSVMIPNSSLKEGAVLGALSLLNKETEPWTMYLGNPARAIKARNQQMKNLVKDSKS
jgi:dTDP-4-amino-4,6-dideoxy-D-glucose acyltransferase